MTRDTDYACCIREARQDKGRIRGGMVYLLLNALTLSSPGLSDAIGQKYQRPELAKEGWIMGTTV